jgi:tetratricopeptide (TPR) repeat protein
MKYVMVRAGVLAVLGLFLTVPSRAQSDQNKNNPSLEQTKPGQVPKDAAGKLPVVAKEETAAYKAVYDARDGEPAHVIELGEAFAVKYPMSVYNVAVYSLLTTAYLSVNQPEKMIDAGTKALALNPDNIDVLPLLAWAIPRRVNAQTPNGPQLLVAAQGYAHHAIDLLGTMAKPAGIDDGAFAKAKNDKLSMCHDGLGVADLKTGKNDDAVTELTEAVKLNPNPDPVEYYLLGVADESGNHFTDAIASFNKCAGDGPMQTQCKSGINDTKKKAQNNVEAPK